MNRLIIFATVVALTFLIATQVAAVGLFNPSFEIGDSSLDPYMAAGWNMNWEYTEWIRVSAKGVLQLTTGDGIEGDWVAMCDTNNSKTPDGPDWIHGELVVPGNYTFTLNMASYGGNSHVWFILDGQTSEFDVLGDGVWRSYSGTAINTKIDSPIWIGAYNVVDNRVFLDNINIQHALEPASMLALLVGTSSMFAMYMRKRK